jgi:lipopolysaccharide/colanic/teichoic acid biosynthesis glycosyltransferase
MCSVKENFVNKNDDSQEKNTQYLALVNKLQFKYILDRVFAAVLILCISPIFLVFSALIFIEGLINKRSAPIIYRETRISAGKPFEMFKFCTVTDQGLRWIAEDPKARSITGCQYRSFAGKVILKFYLDELPQLMNILKGEMSFVGPRPHIIAMHENEIEAGWIYRNYLKGGLLGIPQACKRDPKFMTILSKMAKKQISDTDALNTLDGLYVKKCMKYGIVRIFLMDIAIIFKCLLVVFRGEQKQ